MNARTAIPCPDGVKLDVSRVGYTFRKPSVIRKGETVSFYYSHGSHNGTRTVLVLTSDYNGIEGLTLERDGEYRRYSDEYVNRYKVVDPFVESAKPTDTTEKRVRFDDAGQALIASLTGEALAELYSTHVALEGVGASFDATTGEVVVKLPQTKVAKFVQPTSNNHVEIENKRGERFKFWINQYRENSSLSPWSGLDCPGYQNADITPERLRDELVKFLS